MLNLSVSLLFLLYMHSASYSYYTVKIKDDGPIVKGGTIHIIATVYEDDELSDSKFRYEWEDNAIIQHTRKTPVQSNTDTWTVKYEADKYPLGLYRAQVTVSHCTKIIVTYYCSEIGSERIEFNITGTLNGDIHLTQKNKTRNDNFVATKDPVVHEIKLKKSDADYISTAPTIVTYWFVDCTYYGITTDFQFKFNYSEPDTEHLVEALVYADFTPLPPTTTVAPTTTTKPTTTTTPTTSTTPMTTTTPTTSATSTTPTTPTTSATSTTTATPTTSTSTPTTTTTFTTSVKLSGTAVSTVKPDTSKTVVKRGVVNTMRNPHGKNSSIIMTYHNGMLVPLNQTFPLVCHGNEANSNENKTYGFFYKMVKVKAPISNVNITGNNWIQQGDLLSLRITCSGSKNIEYCVDLVRGDHNVTGNETCENYIKTDTCEFSFRRYLAGKKYTVVIIIKNEVAKVVTPVGVTIYEVKKQAQLSVIVVPVAFSLVAVVLIVFGVAYYIQNRSRFIIEVADFNFGQQYSDMEYKTFRERLRDSITNAFTRGPSPSSSEVPVWPPGRKYGSMT